MHEKCIEFLIRSRRLAAIDHFLHFCQSWVTANKMSIIEFCAFIILATIFKTIKSHAWTVWFIFPKPYASSVSINIVCWEFENTYICCLSYNLCLHLEVIIITFVHTHLVICLSMCPAKSIRGYFIMHATISRRGVSEVAVATSRLSRYSPTLSIYRPLLPTEKAVG